MKPLLAKVPETAVSTYNHHLSGAAVPTSNTLTPREKHAIGECKPFKAMIQIDELAFFL
jgi:hypothetical protein